MPLRIGVVDDDAMVRRAVQRLLEAAGYTVTTFRSGEELLESTALRTLACLVVDVELPGMSGFELQDTLAAAGYAIPMVFTSRRANLPWRHDIVRRAEHVEKPFTEEGLIAAIRRAIETYRNR